MLMAVSAITFAATIPFFTIYSMDHIVDATA